MQETTIKAVHARQVMDCKFRPAVEVDVILACGALGRGQWSHRGADILR